MSCDLSTGQTASDMRVTHITVSQQVRCKNLHVCRDISTCLNCAELDVTNPMNDRIIPVPPSNLPLNTFLAGAGISLSLAGRRIQAGIGCGTGANSIVFDRAGSGSAPTITPSGTVLIGNNNVTTGDDSVIVGNDNIVDSDDGIAIGGFCLTRGTRSMTMGYRANDNPGNTTNIVMGTVCRAETNANYTISLGFECLTFGIRNTILGSQCRANGERSMAIGDGSFATSGADDAAVIGRFLRPTADQQIVIGSGEGSYAGPAIVGQFIFANQREGSLAGISTAGTADNFIPISWNGQLYYIPCDIVP